MHRFLVVLMVLGGISLGEAQTFDDFLDRVNDAPDSQKSAIVDSFMAAADLFPFIEQDALAHFIYRGSASRVNVPGDANSWDANASPMTKIQGTNLWYFTQAFESDARLDYKFVFNGSTWILDPLNPHQVSGGYGPNSELSMPQYVQPEEIIYRPEIPHGILRDTTFFSTHLGNSRTVRIYTPPGYEGSSDRYGMILFHDGLEYVTLAYANRVIDYLIWQGRIEPVIGVFVPPVNRTSEYAGGLKDEFSAFIVEELIPWVDARYRTRPEPACRATLGASNGGNIALWLGLHHADVFGLIAAQSSNVETSIANGFQDGPKLDLTFYLDIGTYDIAVLIPMVRNLRQIVEAKGYEYEYHEYHEGHSWGNWRAHIDDALALFFPTAPPGARGDVNGDMAVNILDAILVVNIILEIQEPTVEQTWAADCNGEPGNCDGDGIANILDVVKIVRLVLELEECE